MMSANTAKNMKAREFSRVDAFIPMDVRLLPEEERDGIRSRISRQTFLLEHFIPDDVEDKVLSEWLHMLNAKLDFIMNTLCSNKEEFCALPFRLVNISAGGIRFASKEGYAKGGVLSIRMVLQKQRPVALHLYGEVVKSEKKGENEYDIAVKFVLIDDEVRDELVRYVFERQREILRAERI
jgi:hypothetical protein